MKAQKVIPPFRPVSVTLTFETQHELRLLNELFGTLNYSNIDSEEVTYNARVFCQKIIESLNNEACEKAEF